MARDYYQDGYEIAERLWEAGQKDWSEKISSVIEGGATATEILMGLRWQLSQLLAADVELEPDTKLLSESLRADVESALG